MNVMQLNVDISHPCNPPDQGPWFTLWPVCQWATNSPLEDFRPWGLASFHRGEERWVKYSFSLTSMYLSNTHCEAGAGMNAWLFWPGSDPLISQNHSKSLVAPRNLPFHQASIQEMGRSLGQSLQSTLAPSVLLSRHTSLPSPHLYMQGPWNEPDCGRKQRWSVSSFSTEARRGVKEIWIAGSNLTVQTSSHKQRPERVEDLPETPAGEQQAAPSLYPSNIFASPPTWRAQW